MKLIHFLFLALHLLGTTALFSQNTNNLQLPTSMNTDGAAPDASAVLDVQATDRGMLTPRMTTAQRTAIATPATGLLVYDTDTGSFWYYENNTWNELAPATLPSESGVNTTGIPIPDNDTTGITSTITLAGTDTVATDTRFRVCLDITHTFDVDLDISLLAPDGTAIDLSSDNGGIGDNYTGTCFTTEATSLISSGSAPFTGNWQPEEPFTNFVDKTITGDWKLKVVDDGTSGQNGQLNHWSLQLSRPSASVTLLADADGDTRVTVEDLPDEDIVRLEAGGHAGLEVRPDSAVFSGLLRVQGSFVSGDFSNTASGSRSFVGGGEDNTASGSRSFIGGGSDNTASGFDCFIGGGANHTVGNSNSFIGGGNGNTILASNTFIGGGFNNTVSAFEASIVGGRFNTSSGDRSFVGGGLNNTVASRSQATFGEYCVDLGGSGSDWVTTDPLFVIGNGTGTSARSNAVTVLKSGRVGIGTAAPRHLLHLSTATTGLASNVSEFGTGMVITASTPRPRIYFEHTAAATNEKVMFMEMINGRLTWSSTIDNATDFVQQDILVLESSGNVGLRVADPSHPLHLASGAHCTSAGVWTNASDRRLKTDIAPLGYGLREIMALRPVGYRMKSNGEAQIGFIAQEVQELLPELVSGTEGEMEKGETLGMSYGNLTAVLVKAVQEQQAIIERSALRIENLERENESLKSQLAEMDELKNRMTKIEAMLSDKNQ